MTSDESKKEVNTTIRWGAGIIITIILQTFGVIWYFAQMDALLNQHTTDITDLQNGSSIYISREQLNDILSGYQTEVKGVNARLERIELKLDRILP